MDTIKSKHKKITRSGGGSPRVVRSSPSRGPKAEWDDPTTDIMGMD